jgi:hypothetical protein
MTVKEIDNKIDYLYDEIDKLRTKCEKQIIGNTNYRNKYLFCEEFGYIYVKDQYFDGDLNLRGFAFAYNISPYIEEFYFKSDACAGWKFPISLWKNYVDREKIQEITKEDFFSTFKKAKEEYNKASDEMLNKIIEE